MSEIIERVAKAIAGDENWKVASDLVRNSWRSEARAALFAMRDPTVEMVAAAYPCEADQEFSHEDKCLGAAVCLRLGGAANIGIFEGETVKQAAFLARDYRMMIDAALTTPALLPQDGKVE